MDYKLALINFWPPFLFSGIRVTQMSKDFHHIKVKLSLRFWNANYLGTQFGGAIYSMTDPFYMLMLIKTLGKNYSVWDKAATIRYLKPGRTALFADFHLTEEELHEIRTHVELHGRMHWSKTVQVKDTAGELIAEVDRTISIKKKD